MVTLLVLVLIVSAFQLAQRYAYHLTNNFDFDFSWGEISTGLMLENLAWAALSPALLVLGRKLAHGAGFLRLKKVKHVSMIVLLALLQKSLALWFYNASFYLRSGYMRDFFGTNNRSELITGFFTSLIEAVVIIGIFMAFDYQKKLANKEKDLTRAQLDALKMQLHPHFLFNTLHSISSMIDIDVKQAQRMITKVGDILRGMLSHNADDFITLKEEIDFARNYLELEQIRFQDRMEIAFDVEEGVVESKVPSLILQPLIENCIKHGVARSVGQSKIAVAASVYQNGTGTEWLNLEIDNSDDLEFQAKDQDSFGIGLKNVENRLRQNYGEHYYCKFEKIDSRHYRSQIRIPFEK